MPEHAAPLDGGAATERSSVTFGDSLDFVLFAHSIGVGAGPFGGVDDLVSKALGNRFHVSESRLAGPLAKKVDSLVDSTEG